MLDECFELFLSLDANDEQLDFPTLYASGRNGYAGTTDDVRSGTLDPLFQAIVDNVPPPEADENGPFKMLATLLDRDSFVGRVLIVHGWQTGDDVAIHPAAAAGAETSFRPDIVLLSSFMEAA